MQNKSKNYSIVTAITPSKILGCQIIKGGGKQHDFLCFVSNLVKYCKLESCSKKIIIFLDNARVHPSKFVQESLTGQVTFLFNAGYSPMLNPIEEFFSKFKKTLRRKPTTNEREIIKAVEDSFLMFKKNDFRGYLGHTLKFAEDSL